MFIHRSRRVLDASKHSFSILEPFIGLGLGPSTSTSTSPSSSLALWLSGALSLGVRSAAPDVGVSRHVIWSLTNRSIRIVEDCVEIFVACNEDAAAAQTRRRWRRTHRGHKCALGLGPGLGPGLGLRLGLGQGMGLQLQSRLCPSSVFCGACA